jgi:transcriptional/translational regulatory protein YebC/TACO1
MVDLEPDSRKAKDLDTLVEQLEEYPSVEEVYTNVRG